MTRYVRERTYPAAESPYRGLMLHDFLIANRGDLIDRCRLKGSRRPAPKATAAELEHGIPLFLDQLVSTLRLEQAATRKRAVSVGAAGDAQVSSEMGTAATQHGLELLQHGFSVDQVIHGYGDLCLAITDLAFEQDTPIQTLEFRTLHRCLDNAMADAVTEFAYQRDLLVAEKGEQALNERLGSLAHELRNLIHTATLAVTALKTGNVGLSGATGAVLDRSLIGLRNLIDRSLADARVMAGMPARYETIALAEFIGEIRVSASLEAQARGCAFHVAAVEPELAVDADRDMLAAAVGNLLQNAFKFTERESGVSLNVHSAADRILIEVQDHCGGLPPGEADKLFVPFMQASTDRSGLGLGLSITRRSVEANNGTLAVRDVPGSGCVFTISLPRRLLAAPAVSVARAAIAR
jgi:signal transduction histidine kinase